MSSTAGSTIQQRNGSSTGPSHRGVAARRMALLDTRDVMEMWPSICGHVVLDVMPFASREPWSEEKMLLAINEGQLEVWVYFEGNTILAVVTTTVTGDAITGTKAILVYSVSGVEKLGVEDWRRMFAAVARYGRSIGATKLVAYTNVGRMVQIVRELGGIAEQVLCELPLGEV